MEIPDPSPFASTGTSTCADQVADPLVVEDPLAVAADVAGTSNTGACTGTGAGTDSQSGSSTPMSRPASRSQHAENEEEDDDIAFAAEAAANAVEEADAEQQRLDQSLLRCRVCGQGVTEGRPLLRFLPMDPALAALTTRALPQNIPPVTTFADDVSLHVFCGKTASILPSVNQPDLEILTKAGLKNKHGIGAEVNAALARTRCAALVTQGSEETTSLVTSTGAGTPSSTSTDNKQGKQYFLVREFEAHLAAIRSTHIHIGSPFSDETSTPLKAVSSSSSSPSARHTPTTTSSTPARNDSKRQKLSRSNYTTTPTNSSGSAHRQLSSTMASTTTTRGLPEGESSAMITNTFVGLGSAPSLKHPRLAPSTNRPLPHPSTYNLLRANILPSSGHASDPRRGVVVPSAGIVMGGPQLMGLANANIAYTTTNTNTNTNTPLNIPYVQMMSQHQNLLLRPQPAVAMFNTNTSTNNANNINNITGQLAQPPIPPPIGAVPLPPPLPLGQQPPLPGFAHPNSGSVGNNALPPGDRSKGTSTSPERVVTARKSVSNPTKSNEKQRALLVPPLVSVGNEADGKVVCGCGGAYYMNAANATTGWQNHVITKRHQRWIESQVKL